ncbi:YdgA family protein [Kalamiella sp. sgz302252]|uniref:YdgA family protein n=1 Tax=Pantoea sp. sgz302252 TaxID=3341827 RepID=UPI0036D41F86
MNKTKVAAGVIIALGVIWTGTAWFTGKQLEKNMDGLVQEANSRLNELVPNGRLKLSYQDWHRGVFSSTLRLVVQSDSQTEDNALLKPGQSLVLAEKIDHGPFPFAQLKKVNLIPSLASVHTQLENTDAVKKLFDMTKGQSAIQADTRVGYGGATASVIHLLPLDYANAQTGERFASNGGTINLSADKKGDRVDYDGELESLVLTMRNQLGIPVMFTINGLKMDGKTHLNAQGLRIGDQNVSTEKFSVAADGQNAFTLDGAKLNSSYDTVNNLVAGTTDFTLDSLKIRDRDFGQGKLTLKVSQFDADGIKAFTDNYRRQVQALMNEPGLNDNVELYQQRMSEILSANLPLLLKGNPVVNIAPLSWKNARGESTFNLSAHFKDPATGAKPQTLTQSVDNVLKTLDGKLTISMEMASEMMTQVAMAEGYKQEEAAKLAEQQVKGVAAMGQMFRLTKQEDNNIVTSLQYASGQVTMNGEKMTLDQFLARYMLGGNPATMPQ